MIGQGGKTALGAMTALALLAAAPARAAEAEDVRAELDALREQVKLLQAQLTELEARAAPAPGSVQDTEIKRLPVAAPAAAATTVEWKGAPEFVGPNGFRFKVRGRLQLDAGYAPNPKGQQAVDTLGFNSRPRRIRLGVEGWLPGDFQYKLEGDFANSTVAYGDVILFWQPKGKVYSFGVGNYDTFENLEQPSSSRYISFLERAQMVEAFDQTRRIGAWTVLADPKHDGWRLQMGVFNDRIRPDNGITQTSFGNNDWMYSIRALATPKLADGRLHFGVNYQHRRFQRNDQSQTYQTRPFTATTDQRFVSTGAIAAHGDSILGVEAAAVLGPFHAVAEAQRVKVRAVRPGEVLPAGQATSGGRRYNGDPVFTGWYAELGWFVTGERRGYKNGLWDRTKVRRPVSEGGPGAIQLNVRYDRLDLNDRVSGTGFSAPDYVAGGIERGLLGSVIWQPIDYVRFTFQYTRASVRGGTRSAQIGGLNGRFSTDLYLARAQFDF
jgi:phosphate-selective porin OprO/OprP